MKLVKEKFLHLIMNALNEDMGQGDITTSAIFEKDTIVSADIIAKERCILAGMDVVKWVFEALDEKQEFKPFFEDGDEIKKNRVVASLRGKSKAILTGERVALNFLGILSGVATLTDRFVRKVKGTGVEIFDTRKTIPGLRELEKYAVKIGGGRNHRMGLWDAILIKDNHLKVIPYAYSWHLGRSREARFLSIKEAIERARQKGYKNIEIEVEDLKEFEKAIDAGADIIMLDNMKIDDIRRAVRIREKIVTRQGKRLILEVSGGINLDNVKAVAETGVDRISIGSLTHSAPSIDFSLEIK